MMFKNLVERTARNPIAWFFFRLCGRLSYYLDRPYSYAQIVRRGGERDDMLSKVTTELFPELIVADGPFRGLRYPAAKSFCGALLPKLLGSYESELQTVLAGMLRTGYSTIVDIGCAEGYYAVGLARALPQVEVYAFDTDPEAKQMCLKMAKLNGVTDRVHMGGLCDEEVLKSLPLGDHALILSDCEGYEGTLFNARMAEFLRKHDVIIETHDFIDIELSVKIRNAFATTHHIQSIKSLDDIERAHSYDCPKLERYSTREKCLILSEMRPTIMEWFVMISGETPRARQSSVSAHHA
jgi:precorrin-6B methylase 2